MNKFTEYLEMQIEGCKRTKAPYRDKIIYQLVLDEYKEQLTLTDVSQRSELLAFIEEVSEFDALVSSTRLRLRAKELLKANCG
jgi:hypothetical protein